MESSVSARARPPAASNATAATATPANRDAATARGGRTHASAATPPIQTAAPPRWTRSASGARNRGWFGSSAWPASVGQGKRTAAAAQAGKRRRGSRGASAAAAAPIAAATAATVSACAKRVPAAPAVWLSASAPQKASRNETKSRLAWERGSSPPRRTTSWKTLAPTATSAPRKNAVRIRIRCQVSKPRTVRAGVGAGTPAPTANAITPCWSCPSSETMPQRTL